MNFTVAPGNVFFATDDRVSFLGSRAARLIVQGNLDLPAGSVVEANAQNALAGAGGGAGGSGANTGGAGGARGGLGGTVFYSSGGAGGAGAVFVDASPGQPGGAGQNGLAGGNGAPGTSNAGTGGVNHAGGGGSTTATAAGGGGGSFGTGGSSGSEGFGGNFIADLGGGNGGNGGGGNPGGNASGGTPGGAGTAGRYQLTGTRLTGGGGVRSEGPTTLTHTIIAGNLEITGRGDDFYLGSTTLTRVGANIVPLSGNDGGATLSGPPLLTTDPLLAPLANYGGPTPTMTLRPGSPARNAAPTSTVTGDQRGFPLVGTPDLGAYEAGNHLPTILNARIWETSDDFDADGASNLLEWLAGTQLDNPASVFRPGLFLDEGDLKISFPTLTGRTYRLQQSSTLLGGSWEDSGQPAKTGNNTLQNFIVTPANDPARHFYRVAISQ